MLGSEGVERLYLQKDASGDISVPCNDLPQHQIDGIRFLFSQYKKEKLGAIVNYPSGCGGSVQVAIFIGAISEKLKRPVLILCESDQEKKAWQARFTNWTSIVEDSIEVDTLNVYVKKQIFIKNVADISQFYRRNWGIVVVKSDRFMNIFRKCQLKVDFKIWITAQDLKKDKELLRSVYSWINPSDDLLQEYFEGKSPGLFREDSTNDMLLDLLLEEFLITRRGLKPFGAHKRKLDVEIQPVVKVSKKNKDATGKKIKRSKNNQEPPSTTTSIESFPSVHDQDNSFFSSSVFFKTSNGDNVTKTKVNAARADDDEESKMDVESFIRDNDPLKSDINLSYALSDLDNTSQPSETSSINAQNLSTEDSLSFASAIADIVRTENNLTDICEDSKSLNAEVPKDNNLNRDVIIEDVESKDTVGLSTIDISEPEIQKVFFVSDREKDTIEPDLLDAGEIKTEKESAEASNEDGNGVADQTRELELYPGFTKQTDFDSRMKELEERALRKFKGSLLDNILNG